MLTFTSDQKKEEQLVPTSADSSGLAQLLFGPPRMPNSD